MFPEETSQRRLIGKICFHGNFLNIHIRILQQSLYFEYDVFYNPVFGRFAAHFLDHHRQVFGCAVFRYSLFIFQLEFFLISAKMEFGRIIAGLDGQFGLVDVQKLGNPKNMNFSIVVGYKF